MIIYIMGVSGSGKTTVGRLLSKKTGLPFLDADDFHPTTNIEKIKAGIPLNDNDRKEWLQTINKLARQYTQQKGVIIACSALKQSYRELLANGLEKTFWFFLQGTFDMINKRLLERKDSFMPASLLQSQFDILEPPAAAITISIDKKPEDITAIIMKYMNQKSSFGIIGLGVMGKSLARNFASKNISLSLYNRFVKDKEEKVADQFIAEHEELKTAQGFDDLNSFVQSLEQPAKILIMVNAGAATDAVMQELHPLLTPGSVVIDGGNSYFKDTERRLLQMQNKGVYWIGAGISGGEEGSLKGPAIMPGGNKEAYEQVRVFLELIAAKDNYGNPCCGYLGAGGAGHFAKMVHNGIEYAEMQLLTEVYYFMRKGIKLNPDAIADIFNQWNHGTLNNYLLEITIDILKTKDNGDWLLDNIADRAMSKGTGSLATQTAASLGSPAGMMTSALFARFLSAQNEIRIKGQQYYSQKNNHNLSVSIEEIRSAYELARIINHHQGFQFIKTASDEYGWNINPAQLAALWTNGCIIRSTLMNELAEMFKETTSVLFHKKIIPLVKAKQPALAKTVAEGIINGMAAPVLCEAQNYLNAIAEADSPMNLIQAQRDYFGAHAYLLKNDPEWKPVHTEWKKYR